LGCQISSFDPILLTSSLEDSSLFQSQNQSSDDDEDSGGDHLDDHPILGMVVDEIDLMLYSIHQFFGLKEASSKQDAFAVLFGKIKFTPLHPFDAQFIQDFVDKTASKHEEQECGGSGGDVGFHSFVPYFYEVLKRENAMNPKNIQSPHIPSKVNDYLHIFLHSIKEQEFGFFTNGGDMTECPHSLLIKLQLIHLLLSIAIQFENLIPLKDFMLFRNMREEVKNIISFNSMKQITDNLISRGNGRMAGGENSVVIQDGMRRNCLVVLHRLFSQSSEYINNNKEEEKKSENDQIDQIWMDIKSMIRLCAECSKSSLIR